MFAVFLPLALCKADDPKPKSDSAAIERVAVEGLTAMKRLQWDKLAPLAHPESLQHFKEQLLPTIQLAEKTNSDPALKQTLKQMLTLEPRPFYVRFMNWST